MGTLKSANPFYSISEPWPTKIPRPKRQNDWLFLGGWVKKVLAGLVATDMDLDSEVFFRAARQLIPFLALLPSICEAKENPLFFKRQDNKGFIPARWCSFKIHHVKTNFFAGDSIGPGPKSECHSLLKKWTFVSKKSELVYIF
jgi:hypothetical protein